MKDTMKREDIDNTALRAFLEDQFIESRSPKGKARNTTTSLNDDSVGDQTHFFIHSKEALAKLDMIFPVKVWEPGVDKDELIYNAGERRVIDHIRRRLTTESMKVIG